MSTSHEKSSDSQTRDLTINIRAKQNQRDLIDRETEVQNKSRSEFMLKPAYQKAQDVILERSFFGLDEVKFQQFIELLDAPPKPNENLRVLLKNKPLWD